MKPETWLISLLIVGMISVGFIGFMGALNNQYGIEIDSEYESVYDTYDSVQEVADIGTEMSDKLTNQTKIGTVDAYGNLLTAFLNTGKLIFSSINALRTMIISSLNLLGLPQVFTVGLISIGIIAIVFSIMRFILGKDD